VYWRRRLVAAVGALVLVFVIAHLLGGGSDGKSDDPVAQQAGAPLSTTTSATTSTTTSGSTTGTTSMPTSSGTPVGTPTVKVPKSSSTAPLVLTAPSGACDPRDITVTPSVDHAVAGSDVTVKFALQTKTNPACTWQMTPQKLAVKITRHGRVLWTSQQCAKELPTRSVVIRNVVPSLVTMVWNGEVSVDGCRPRTPWVHPGKLTVWASTLGGEPGHSDFDLVLPAAQTIEVTPKGDPTSTGTAEPKR
jgi:hypothetical protein